MQAGHPGHIPGSRVSRKAAFRFKAGVFWLRFGMEWALSACGEPPDAWRRLEALPVTLVSGRSPVAATVAGRQRTVQPK